MTSARQQSNFKPNEVLPNNFRFIIYPIDPAPMHVIKNHKLNFDCELTPLKQRLIPRQRDNIYQNTHNYFDVKAMFANTYQDIKAYFIRRNMQAETNKLLVVDIPKEYFPEMPEQISIYKKPTMDFKNHKIYIEDAEIREGLYSISHSCQYTPQLPGYPVYQQTITTSIGCFHNNALFFDDIISTDSKNWSDKDALAKHTALTKKMEIRKYDADPYHQRGMDLLFANNAPIHTVAYRRERHGLSDWCTTQRYFINRNSYLNLTGGLIDENANAGKQNFRQQANAERIAQLFLDYAGLRPGVSAFFHFNLFRHSKNILVAKEIANELLKPESQAMSNLQIAQFLQAKYTALQSDHYKVWQIGSFNRRMSYAITQLTNGVCQTMDEFNHTHQENLMSNANANNNTHSDDNDRKHVTINVSVPRK